MTFVSPKPIAALPADDLEKIVAEARDDLLTFRGKSIFFTGGTGFIGGWMIESLLLADTVLSLGLRIHALTRDPERYAATMPHIAGDRRVTLEAGDVRALKPEARQIDLVIHAATDASAGLNAEDPLRMADTIVEGTRRTLETARLSGVEKVLMLSSGGVYGHFPPDVTRVEEDHNIAPDPLNPYYTYSESKRMAELLCAIYAKQFGMCIPVARIFALIGPRLPLDIHFAAGNFVRDALENRPIRVAGDGTAVRSYLYAADLTVWLLALAARGASSRAYNVGSDQGVTIRELAEVASRLGRTKLPVEVAGDPNASNPVNHYVPSVRRIEKELGVRISTSLEDGMLRTYRWNSELGN